jgi:hypothetical protein
VQVCRDIQIEPDVRGAPGSPCAAPGTPDHVVGQASEVWRSHVPGQAGARGFQGERQSRRTHLPQRAAVAAPHQA